MSNLFSLDKVKGTLTLLNILSFDQRPFQRLELLDEMNKRNIGRSATYKAITALVELGLIVEKQGITSGKRVIWTYPTERGFKVAEKIEEIIKIIDEMENVSGSPT